MSENQPYPEKELLLRIANGDEKAFGDFVRLYSSKLYTYMYRITQDQGESEELVQDIFIQLWQTRETLGAVHNPGAYLYILSRNRAYNALKRLIRQKHALHEWQMQPWLREDNDDAADKLNLLDKAVEQLPPQQKNIWQMSRIQRMKYAEIAAALGITKDAVNKALQAAGKNITQYVVQHLDVLLLFYLGTL